MLPPNCDLDRHVIIRHQVIFSVYSRKYNLSHPLRLPAQRTAYSQILETNMYRFSVMKSLSCSHKNLDGGKIHPSPHNWDSRGGPPSVTSPTSDVPAHYRGQNVNLAQWVLTSQMWIPTLTLVGGQKPWWSKFIHTWRCRDRTKKQAQELKYSCLCWQASNKIGNSEVYIESASSRWIIHPN